MNRNVRSYSPVGNTRSAWLFLLGLSLACMLDRVAAQDRTPTLRRGSAWSEEAAKKKLEEYAATWSDRASWEKRAAAVREGILRGSGLLPLPPKTALNPIWRGERRHDGYIVENVAFESLPGFFVTGNLYRPTSPPAQGGSPGILVTHGHCTGITTPFGINKTGGRFGGETQRICAVMARMGAVVFAYDMTGVNEAQQYPHTGPMAMTVQLWDSIRAIDFLTSMPQVDPRRIGITGASGGGTQSFLLAAVDERVKVSIPTVQVSAYFFGGCTCESGMPIHVSDSHDTCNAEIAALHAPRPLLVISDGKDWTKNTPLVEFPYIRRVYRAYGAEDAAENLHLPLEGHDYGPSKRQGAYAFFAKHLGLRIEDMPHAEGKIDESLVTPETYDVLCVFDDMHPRPAGAIKDPAAVEAWLRGTRRPQGEEPDSSRNSAREFLKTPYPRVAMLWASIRGDNSVASMAKHDLVMAGSGSLRLRYEGTPQGLADRFTADSLAAAQKRIAEIRALNPDVVIIGDLLFYEYPDNWLPEDHPWWLRKNGQRQQFWPGTHRMDWYNEEYRRHVVRQTVSLKEAGVDGVFYDNIRNEPQAWVAFLHAVREALGDDFLILANAGYAVGEYDFAAPYLNGMMYESGWSHDRTQWDDCVAKMQHTQSLLRQPRISLVERFEEIRSRAGWPGDSKRGQKPPADPQARRWSLCYALTIGDFYYLFSDNTSHRHDWYPEYDCTIGLPLAAGQGLGLHVWQRQYEKALVVVNLPGAQGPYEVKLERPARDSLTGESGTRFTIPPGDGRILLIQ